jgi:hypothetical protein
VNALVQRTRVILVVALGLAGPLALAGRAGASPAAPYTDPAVVGSIGLCNQAGQQITSGSVTAKPFAWRAVSTQPAQAPYDNAGRTATLVAYQPLQSLPPGDWSGAQMTSSSSYTNPANPMAAATDGDQSLQDIIAQYPPQWDGFLQLRMYLSTSDKQPYTLHYPALNIQVTGSTWQAIGGSPVNCASGTAVSIESVLLPSATTPPPPPSTTTTTTTTTTTASGAGTSSGTTPASDADSSAGRKTTAGSALGTGVDASTQSSNLPVLLGIVLAVLVVLSTIVLLALRRRRQASGLVAAGSPVPPSTSSSTTKGDTQ